ncbi:hypothetical protein LIER_25136 [Lithospermum erythrorhizon]|uniref:Uncharacterized protein n=1 Tax=Lithospermum erythrorhizon TaxID=34254 RepID=A0AAV3R4W0_LITER
MVQSYHLSLETPRSKDELTARVRQYVELEELKNKECQKNICEMSFGKGHDPNLQEIIQFGKGFSKTDRAPKNDNMKTCPKGLVRCKRTTGTERTTPLRVSIAEVFS